MSLEVVGYEIIEQAVDVRTVNSLIEFFESHAKDEHGLRNILSLPIIQSLSTELLAVVKPILGDSARPVRGIFFDKNPSANWKVPWHQDLSIAVAERHEISGYGPWSRKNGVVHVQPPAEVLESMLTARLHLDDCGADNGALRVLPGSHRLGKLKQSEIDGMTKVDEVTCSLQRGGVLLMKPLLLHASSPAVSPRHRRVVHLEYASTDLPLPLRWAEFRSGESADGVTI